MRIICTPAGRQLMEQVMSEGENRDQGDSTVRGKRVLSPITTILTSRRLRPLFIVAPYMFLIFLSFRIAMLLVGSDAVQDITVGEICRCFGYGFQFDAVIVGYTILPLVLCLGLASRASFSRKTFRRTITIYITVLMTLALVLEIVNIVFLMEFRRRLNWASLSYSMYPHVIARHIWEAYGVWVVLLIPAVLGGVYLLYRTLRRYCWGGSVTFNSSPRRVALTAVLGVLCVLACRPTFGRFPLRLGSEVHSTNNLVNQASTNTWFVLWHAIVDMLKDGEDEGKYYDFPSDNEARQIVRKLLFQDGDQPAPSPGRPLRRRVETGREMQDLNVVVIIMEGQSNAPVGAMGYGGVQTPELDELCRDGLFFDQLYAAGARTSRGITGVLVGHPDLGGETLLKRDEALGKFQTLPGVMAGRGYSTMFINGGDSNFDNMKNFLAAGGTHVVVGQKEIDAQNDAAWGVPDEDIFHKAHEMFVEMGDKKFFAAILTISNHQSYENFPQDRTPMIPGDSDDIKMLNAYRYADWALGDFFREARDADYFKNTLFVIVADHGHGRYLNRALSIDVPGYRIPCVFYAPGIVSPRRISTVASQTDIAPTVLGVLGGGYEHSFLGRDILRVNPGDGFALLHEDKHFAFVRPGRAMVIAPINYRTHPVPVPEMFNITLLDMHPVPRGYLDANETVTMKRDMLSLYSVALQQYLSVKKKGK